MVSVREMRELDRRAIEEKGVPAIMLMENAGRSVSDVILDMLGADARSKKVSVFCGTGNNGGDGFVTARYLAEKGVCVRVYIVGDHFRIKGDPAINLSILEKSRLEIKEITSFIDIDADLIIDAIFGIGLKGDVREPGRDIISGINKKSFPIVSIDVPSGLDADTGEVLGVAIKAGKTVTMQFAKKGFYINEGPEHTGEVLVVDIGIPEELCAE
ncbi:MAG: NAD(P)H-hydrate epimerase [Candidatus Omnitrophica bacterium]|nr:NAD(P)H-hydrate epimerase [Candidatus Omnitrophota bacterium]